MTAPCRHPVFSSERQAKRRAWAIQQDPALRMLPVQCRYCGQWRLEAPGSSYHAAAAADQGGRSA